MINYLATEKYKTQQVQIRFISNFTGKKATERSLLANVLEYASETYQSRQAIDQQLTDLYGASYDFSTNRLGNYHFFTVNLSLVDGRYLSTEQNLLAETSRFIVEMLMNPLLDADRQAFNVDLFERQKDDLLDYYESIVEDKSTYASHALNEMMFRGSEQSYSGHGHKKFLGDITPESLYQTYQDMLAEDWVHIQYASSHKNAEAEEVLARLNPSQGQLALDPFVDFQVADHVKEEEDHHDIKQGKLYMGFSQPAYYRNENYHTMQIFNGLFGSFPHSKLFQNVREKASLAYTASSSVDYYRGLLLVRTGIDFENYEKAKEIILAQVKAMQEGDFEDQALEQTKAMLVNGYIQGADSQHWELTRYFIKTITGHETLEAEAYKAALDQVSRQDVVELAQEIRLDSIFYLNKLEAKNA